MLTTNKKTHRLRKKRKKYVKWEPEIRINVERKIKNVISIALRTQFMCRRFKRRNKRGCLFFDSFKMMV